MEKNLFDYIDNHKLKEDVNKEINNSFDDKTKEDVNKLYEKYKDYNEQELLQEFLSTSRQKIKDGSLDKSNLEKTINSLSPYLSSSQKSFLENLINKIDE